MKRRTVFYLEVVLLCLLSYAVVELQAECANACSGHGRCTAFDMCICYRNWQANDCSQRMCMFGPAHVDTPKVRTRYVIVMLFIIHLLVFAVC